MRVCFKHCNKKSDLALIFIRISGVRVMSKLHYNNIALNR